jgi:hypothetical protein
MVILEDADNPTTHPLSPANTPHYSNTPGLGSFLPRRREGGLQTTEPPLEDATREFGGGNNPTPHQAPHNHAQTNNNIRNQPKKRKKTRANLNIASLNIKGRTSLQLDHSAISKWSVIHQVMREKKIGILCLQETHLTEECENQINTLYSRRLRVINSRDREHPGSSAGVAFVLNKELTNTKNIEFKEIIPGRALILKTQWHNNEKLTILNIYAPNNPVEHHNFWSTIKNSETNSNNQQINLLLGDFNLTEDPLDRAPA